MMTNQQVGLYKLFTTVILLFVMSIAAYAQKLPSIQKNSIYAPVNTVIDGKPTEWGNKFQAYNSATEIYYTIANDDVNLYLVVQAISPQMIQKTMMRGISFAVNSSVNKNDKTAVNITFPVMKRPDYQRILRIALSRFDGGTYQEVQHIKDTALKARVLDTLMRRSNEQIPANAKMIGVNGIKEIQDSTISVYNDYDIQANTRFDKKMALTYEFAIPLKYLGLSKDKPGPFAYNIKLNGADKRYINEGGGGSIRIENGVATITNPIPLRNQNIVGTTDFWGEYTLAKK